MPVFWATLLNLILILILAQFSAPKAFACTPSIFFKPNLVLARYSEISPTDNPSLTLLAFQKIFNFKGGVTPNFYLVFDSKCPNCPSTFSQNQMYLISLESVNTKGQYRLPQCQQIMVPVSGPTDSQLIFNIFKIATQPLWASIFLFALLISSLLDNFLPTVIAIALSIIVLLEIFGWSIVFLVRRLRR